MLALLQLLVATTLLSSANGCGDEAKKSSGLPMSARSDTSHRFRRVSHEDKPNRINSFNGSDKQMIGENITNELQTIINNCSNALVANEYLSRSNGSNNSKHDISMINNNMTDLSNFIPVNSNPPSKVLPKSNFKTIKRTHGFISASKLIESRPRKYLEDLESIEQYQPSIPSSLDQIKAKGILSTNETPAYTLARATNHNFSSDSGHRVAPSRLLAFHPSIKAQPTLISNRKHYKYYLKNREQNSDSHRWSRPPSPDSYSRKLFGTKLIKSNKECSKRDSKNRIKRHRERYGSVSSLLRHSSSDRHGIFVADNTGFDAKAKSDRTHTEISNLNNVAKNLQQSQMNEKSGNSSKYIKAERLEGYFSTSVESIEIPKLPVMVSLSPNSNESDASYPVEPDLPSPDIVPLEDLRTDVDEAPRNRSLPGDPKRPYFPIDKAPVVNESASELNGMSVFLDEDVAPLRCIICTSTTDHNHCYNIQHSNQTDDSDIEDLSQACPHRDQTYCLASHVWYVDKSGENRSYHHFSIERRCAAYCEPYYIVMGDKTKMEIISNRTCCTTDNCNSRNAAADGTLLKSQLVYKVSFAVLTFFKLMKLF